MKRSLALVLSVLLVSAVLPGAVLAGATPLTSLVLVEELLYGQAQEGSLLGRVEQIEEDIYGSAQEGAVLLRINRVHTFLDTAPEANGGLQLFLNLAEWGFTASLEMGQPLIERLENMEIVLFGEPQTGNIAGRAEQMMFLIWGTTRLDGHPVMLPKESLVKIALLDSVDSAKAQIGDVVNYRVVEDVKVGDRIVVPVGVQGQGRVSEVSSAGRLGKDGRVVLDFGKVGSLDGTWIKLRVDETATQENKSLEWAAGASMAGIILLGPVGVVGGYFVKGKDVKIESNTEFFVETAGDVELTGFLFRPAPK